MKKRLRGYIFSKMSFVIIFVLFGLVFYNMSFAVTFQQEIGVNFTFNSSISLSLSSDDIHIYNLAPGSASDSNVIDVRVLTNSINGYTLNATVGNNTTYNTRDLTHSNSNINNPFTSIDFTNSPTITTNTDLASDKWAFSFSLDNGTNWSNYNGLPLYSDTTNIATLKTSSGPSVGVNGDEVKFKIAAKASENKPSGEYNNVINFTLVGTPEPGTFEAAFQAAGKQRLNGYYKMQDMDDTICDAVELIDSETSLIDTRDNKVYSVAKLKDGNCWMTQNLDLDLDSTRTYTNQDTDLGYNTSTGQYDTASWTPNSSTLTSANASSWVGSDTAPYSFDPGDLYWNGATSDWTDWGAYYDSCTWNDTLKRYENCNESLNPITNYTSSTGDSHYHLGNYYNWTAAVAINDSTHTTSEGPIEQSICPAGWTLPRVGNGDDTFKALWEEYGWDENDQSFSDITDLTGSPLYFPASGDYDGMLYDVGHYGSFWSPVVNGGYNAYSPYFQVNGYANPSSNDGDRYYGHSIRCVARPVSTTVTMDK